jgi:hypothetical protein
MRMDFNNMEELLKKYWNCETTLEEEKQLREFFAGNNIPDQWKETAAMFRYFDAVKKKSINDLAFDGQVLRNVNATKESKVRRLVYNAMRIAAGLAVVIAATWFIRTEIRSSMPQEVVDTYDDPKMAFEETKKALLIISKSFGTAEAQTRKINMFNEAQEEIQRERDPEL